MCNGVLPLSDRYSSVDSGELVEGMPRRFGAGEGNLPLPVCLGPLP